MMPFSVFRLGTCHLATPVGFKGVFVPGKLISVSEIIVTAERVTSAVNRLAQGMFQVILLDERYVVVAQPYLVFKLTQLDAVCDLCDTVLALLA